MITWLDIVLTVIILIALVMGFVKGLIRELIGVVAAIAGLVVASRYYFYVGKFLDRLISEKIISNFLGFLVVFFAVLTIGALLASLLSKLIKGPLKFFNHLLGGVFGFIEGVLVCGVFVFALLVFPINKEVLLESNIAPYCFGVTKTMIYIIPRELKEKFKESYQNIVQKGEGHGKKI